MKKFLVPVRYSSLYRVEVESESVHKLRDDIKNGRLDLPIPEASGMEYLDGDYEIDSNYYMIDVDSDTWYEV